MTKDQSDWFVNGHHWTLSMLRLAGYDIDMGKMLECLDQLHKGTLSGMDTPEESIMRLRKALEGTGDELTEEKIEELEKMLRETDSEKRRRAMDTDRECAEVVITAWTGSPDGIERLKKIIDDSQAG